MRSLLAVSKSLVITPVITLMLVGSPVAAGADLNAGLVSHYPCDGSADDPVGGRNGTVHGATFAPDRFGNPNSSCHFNEGDYIQAPADGLPTGERTMAFWFRADDLSTLPSLVGYGGGGDCGSGGGTSWITAINPGVGLFGNGVIALGYHCYPLPGSPELIYYYCKPPTGRWVHLATRTDPTGTRMYLDGRLVAENAVFVNNTFVTGRDLGIGVAPSPSGVVPYTDQNIGYFVGDIDDVRIYDRALSTTEIQMLAQGATPDACCTTVAAAGCRPPASTKAVLKIKVNAGDGTKNRLQWKWGKGAMTTKSEFGNPTGAENYALCVYDNGALISIATVEAGGVCAGKPCWKETSTGYKFKDKNLTPDGAFRLNLKEGVVDGNAQVQFKGQGALLHVPATSSIIGPLVVQLNKASDEVCWGATFSAPFTKQDAANFSDKSD